MADEPRTSSQQQPRQPQQPTPEQRAAAEAARQANNPPLAPPDPPSTTPIVLEPPPLPESPVRDAQEDHFAKQLAKLPDTEEEAAPGKVEISVTYEEGTFNPYVVLSNGLAAARYPTKEAAIANAHRFMSGVPRQTIQ